MLQITKAVEIDDGRPHFTLTLARSREGTALPTLLSEERDGVRRFLPLLAEERVGVRRLFALIGNLRLPLVTSSGR
jgi:hypothetical protein